MVLADSALISCPPFLVLGDSTLRSMDPGQVSQVIDVAIKWEHADSEHCTVLFT